MMNRTLLVSLLLALSWTGTSHGETTPAETVPFDSERWEISAAEHRFAEHLGRPSLYLEGGLALLRDVELTDGVIGFDVAFSGQRGFLGGVWRLLDEDNHEHFYVRPHQSGKPDANQYTPVFHGLSAWQLYHGPGYAAEVSYEPDTWIHIEIVFAGGRGEVYIDSEEPVLVIPEMKREVRSGRVGVQTNFTPAWFSRFSYRKLVDEPAWRGELPAPQPTPPGTVTSWSVSNVFAASSLDGKVVLSDAEKSPLRWATLGSERTGITNLARLREISAEADTVFARIVVHAERDEVRKIRFGYSDRVRVYLDDRLIYGGDNGYRSRDFRYLGTIGLFDELWLPLREGTNELWFAVSESFGGWGVLARFEDLSGLRLEP